MSATLRRSPVSLSGLRLQSVRIPAICSSTMHRISIRIGASPIDTTIEKSKFGQSRHTVFDIARPKRKARFLAGLLKNETTRVNRFTAGIRCSCVAFIHRICGQQKARWANHAGFGRNFDYGEMVAENSRGINRVNPRLPSPTPCAPARTQANDPSAPMRVFLPR